MDLNGARATRRGTPRLSTSPVVTCQTTRQPLRGLTLMQANTKLPGEAEHLMVLPLCSYTFVAARSLCAGVSIILKGDVTLVRDCLLSAAISQPIMVMCSLQMLMTAAGEACLYAHSDAELRDRRATGVRLSAQAWRCWLCCLHDSCAPMMSWEACPPKPPACCYTCSRLLCMAWRCFSTWPQQLASVPQTLGAEGHWATPFVTDYGFVRRHSNPHRDTEAHWCRAPPGLTQAQVALASVCTLLVLGNSSSSTLLACLPAIHNTTAQA